MASTYKSTLNIEICGMINNSQEECGYCKKHQSYSFGFYTDNFPVELYEKMQFEGWRRSGTYTYKPDVFNSCCKTYSCRLNVEKFQINKNQKKIMRRFRRYLSGEYEKERENRVNNQDDLKEKKQKIKDEYQKNIEKIIQSYIEQNAQEIESKFFKGTKFLQWNQIRVMKNKVRAFGDYSTNLLIALSVFQAKTQEMFSKEAFEQLLFEHFSSWYKERSPQAYTLTLSKTGHLNFKVVNSEEYESFLKGIEKCQKPNPPKKEKKEEKKKYTFEYFPEIVQEPEIFLPLKHEYTVEISEKITATPEKLELYKKYQLQVHKEEDEEFTEERYNSSLGNSNLTSDNIEIPYKSDFFSNPKNKILYPKKYGTYNFIHRIDGKIVAVGVWDFLPTSLSSVYLYYDPDYSFLDLGLLTAIREIEYVKAFHDLVDNKFTYYVLGFYCDTLQKLRYKGEFFPTEILEPTTLNYVNLEDVRKLIENNKTLKVEGKVNPNHILTQKDIDNIYYELVVVCKNSVYDLDNYIHSKIKEQYQDQITKQVKKLISLIGKEFPKFVTISSNGK